MSPVVDHQDDIVRDSIIKNKERTKSYWEQLMMAASENQNLAKSRPWDSTESSDSNSPSNRNSVSSIDYTEDTTANHHEVDGEEVETEEAVLELTNVKDERKRIEREIRLAKERQNGDFGYGTLTMEDRIAMELQEMKEREEELRQLRKKLSDEIITCKETSTPKDNTAEELSSIHTTDDSNYSEYGSEEKEHSLDGNNSSRGITPYSEGFLNGRTQSLDSVSSGHSSGSASTLNERDRSSPRRRNIVRPYEDPEEQAPATFKRNEKETPIEKEIRLAKEREEELRREKGVVSNVSTENETNIFKLQPKLKTRKNGIENDPRGVQHRLATNRIQQEIEEASERENELRTEGKILTTSEETVDAKVTRFTQLAEFAILENRHKNPPMKRSSSASQLLVAVSNEEKVKEIPVAPPAPSVPVKTYVPTVTRRYATNPVQRGIMQRFIAGKGKLSMSAINATPNYTSSPAIRPASRRANTVGGEMVVPTRKGYTSAEEKIQEELKEMRKREEELRLQRAHMFARSQPNLLDISQDEEELHSWTSHKENKTVPRMAHSLSNPNLLDDTVDKVSINTRTSRKRFSLLQEWENRIQSVQQDV